MNMSSSVAQTFTLLFFLVCYSNIYNRRFQAKTLAYRVQTSLKRHSLKFSLRYDISAKFPKGGSRTFLA